MPVMLVKNGCAKGETTPRRKKTKTRTAEPAFGDGAAVVEDIFRHGKTEADHGGVDDAVDHVVELVAFPEVEDDKSEAFPEFFDDGGGESGGGHAGHFREGAVGDGFEERVENKRDEDGHRRAPDEGRRSTSRPVLFQSDRSTARAACKTAPAGWRGRCRRSGRRSRWKGRAGST